MKDFLCFRKMIMPVIVQILFWLVVLYSIIIAVVDFAHAKYWYGVAIIIFGPLLARVAAELIMIFFVVVPIFFGGFANFLLPYHVGSKDVAYPRLNSLGF